MAATFIDRMVEYYQMLSDGDPIFMKFGASQLLGFLLGKNSNVDVTPDKEQLNLYMLFISDSFYGRKNVAQDIMKSFYPLDKILPNETSSEKFIANLVENSNGIWFAGEFSKILKHINKGHYLSDIVETMNDLYNYKHPLYVRTIMKEDYVIQYPYPQFNSTLTPQVLQEQITTEMLDGGFFGRLLLIPGKASDGTTGRSKIPAEAIEIKKELQTVIDTVYDLVAIKKKNIQFVFDDESLELLNKIERELAQNQTIKAVAGRYGQAIIKLSAIIHFSRLLGETIASDSKNNLNRINNNNSKYNDYTCNTTCAITTIPTTSTITDFDLREAYEMVKPCIEYAETLYHYISMNRRHIIKVREYIRDNYPVLRSKVSRYCNLDSRELKEAEDTLWGMQEIMKIIRFQKIKDNGTKCRIQTVYCLYDVDKSKCKNCKYKEYCEDDLE